MKAFNNHKTVTLSINQLNALSTNNEFNNLTKREQNEITDFLY